MSKYHAIFGPPGFMPKDTKGENNPFWGKTHNDETKAKISRKGVRGHE